MDKLTMTPDEVLVRLRELGIPMHIDTLRTGMEQGVFPFAICIRMTERKFLVSKQGFEEWIKQFFGVKIGEQNDKQS